MAHRLASSAAEEIEKLLKARQKNIDRLSLFCFELLDSVNFCEIQSSKGRGKCYQPETNDKVNNTYRDYKAEMKNVIAVT